MKAFWISWSIWMVAGLNLYHAYAGPYAFDDTLAGFGAFMLWSGAFALAGLGAIYWSIDRKIQKQRLERARRRSLNQKGM
jgi:hypothetical protein